MHACWSCWLPCYIYSCLHITLLISLLYIYQPKKKQNQSPKFIPKKSCLKKKITSKKTHTHTQEKKGKKKKKKKKSNWSHRQAHVQLHMDIFVQKLCPIFIFSFLSILERTVFGESNDKTPEFHYLFSFLPTQPNIL